MGYKKVIVAIVYSVCMIGLIVLLMMTGGGQVKTKASEPIAGLEVGSLELSKGDEVYDRGSQEADLRIGSGGPEGEPIQKDSGERNSQLQRNSKSRASNVISSRDGRNDHRGSDYGLRNLGDFVITAYTAGFESTGKRPGDTSYGQTASGAFVKKNRTIAADWKVLKPGTEVMIEGLPHVYLVEDRGSAVKGNRLDIYIADLNKALEWGKQKRQVWLVER